MHLLFSRRERARKAAIEADARYAGYVEDRVAKGQPVQERWSYIINAALEAAVGDLPDPLEAEVDAAKKRNAPS